MTAADATYTVGVSQKGVQFDSSARVSIILENAGDLDFVGNQKEKTFLPASSLITPPF